MAMKFKIPKLNPFKFRNHRLIPNFDFSINIPASLSNSAKDKLMRDRHISVVNSEPVSGYQVRLSSDSVTINKSEYEGPISASLFPNVQILSNGSPVSVSDIETGIEHNAMEIQFVLADTLPQSSEYEDIANWFRNVVSTGIHWDLSRCKVPIDDNTLNPNVSTEYSSLADEQAIRKVGNQCYFVTLLFTMKPDAQSEMDMDIAISSCQVTQVGDAWDRLGVQFSQPSISIQKSNSICYADTPLSDISFTIKSDQALDQSKIVILIPDNGFDGTGEDLEYEIDHSSLTFSENNTKVTGTIKNLEGRWQLMIDTLDRSESSFDLKVGYYKDEELISGKCTINSSGSWKHGIYVYNYIPNLGSPQAIGDSGILCPESIDSFTAHFSSTPNLSDATYTINAEKRNIEDDYITFDPINGILENVDTESVRSLVIDGGLYMHLECDIEDPEEKLNACYWITAWFD